MDTGKETLFIDIVRVICEINRSETIPRWLIIGWVLELYMQNHHNEVRNKLSMIYDWLFFDKRVDNIMNINPAALLMVGNVWSKYRSYHMCQLVIYIVFMG